MGPLSKKLQERKVLIGSIIALLLGVLIRIDYQFIKNDGSDMHQSIYQYIAGSILIIAGAMACESCAIAIMAQVSSPVISLGLFNASFVSGLGAVLGRSLGNIVVGITAAIFGTESISLYMYTGFAIVFAILTMSTLGLYRKLEKLSYAQQYISDSNHETEQEDTRSKVPITQ